MIRRAMGGRTSAIAMKTLRPLRPFDVAILSLSAIALAYLAEVRRLLSLMLLSGNNDSR
jgi:hypothetical protein